MKFFEWRHVGLCGRPVWSAGWQFVTFTFKCLPAGRLTARPWDWTGESRRETPARQVLSFITNKLKNVQ